MQQRQALQQQLSEASAAAAAAAQAAAAELATARGEGANAQRERDAARARADDLAAQLSTAQDAVKVMRRQPYLQPRCAMPCAAHVVLMCILSGP